MKDILKLHNEAMDLALQGDMAVQSGKETSESLDFYMQAFEKEREAALLADFMQNPEPGLSILYRSAASLAMQCGKYREGEQLIAKALSGNPTDEIARELRELLQEIYALSGHSDGTVIYNLEVPDIKRSNFESLIRQLGLSVSHIRKAIGHVALL